MVNSIFTQGEPLSHIFTYGSAVSTLMYLHMNLRARMQEKINPNSMLTGDCCVEAGNDLGLIYFAFCLDFHVVLGKSGLLVNALLCNIQI